MANKNPSKYSVPEDQQEGEILSNLLDIKIQKEIDQEEFLGFFNAQEIFVDKLNQRTKFNLKYLYSIHKTALEHLYSFAGKLRNVNMSKGGFTFPAARFLPESMEEFEMNFLRPLNAHYEDKEVLLNDLAKAHAELLFIHPFREGNGRTARLLTNLIALKQLQKQLDFSSVLKEEKPAYILAVQQASQKEYSLMEKLFRKLL